ncbi:hypothetical protein NLJ89_g3586 [Agrocybe chaxingu]|uniref:Uncharacterized protein n=1 Tax=Agrocybe chaxingu TaxID=84603 RepID=A0A9W8KAU9_9AGAR|nr:hypothetical protein NLJ89_g3586 [Agrocybe chaxingu]
MNTPYPQPYPQATTLYPTTGGTSRHRGFRTTGMDPYIGGGYPSSSSYVTEHTIPTQATAGSYAMAPGSTATVIYPNSSNSYYGRQHHHRHHSSSSHSPRPSYSHRHSRSVGASPAYYTMQLPAQGQGQLVQATMPMELYGAPTQAGGYPGTYGAGGMGYGSRAHTQTAMMPAMTSSSAYSYSPSSSQGYSNNYPYGTQAQALMPATSSVYGSYPGYSNNSAPSSGGFLNRVFGRQPHQHNPGMMGIQMGGVYAQPQGYGSQGYSSQGYGSQVAGQPGMAVVLSSGSRRHRRQRSY